MQMHKLRLKTWSSFSFLLESYRGTWVVTSKSKKNRSASNQFGNAFQTLFFTDFARDSSDAVSRPIFGSLSLEGFRSRLGLEAFRSRDFEYCKEMVY